MFELDRNIDDVITGAQGGFDKPKGEWKEPELDGLNEQHVGATNAFAAHILRGEPLVAEGVEGINGLTISMPPSFLLGMTEKRLFFRLMKTFITKNLKAYCNSVQKIML